MIRKSALRTFLASAAVVPLIAPTLAGCGSSGNSGASASAVPPTTPGGQPATVGVTNSGLGNILVDAQGYVTAVATASRTPSCWAVRVTTLWWR